MRATPPPRCGRPRASCVQARHRGEGRPDADAVYTIPIQDVTLPPEEAGSRTDPTTFAADKAGLRKLKKQVSDGADSDSLESK